jgi:mannose-1-phosphate guanylyltransferase
MTFATTVDLSNVHVCILAGGSGTRLWPRSRQGCPKQFLNLVGSRSLLQHTVQRVLPLVPAERVYILTGPDHAALVAEQLPQLPQANIWVEPCPRGTAPCLGLAALKLRQTRPGESVMISLHADHVIVQEERFREALLAAVITARSGYLVTIGIVPNAPETGFGYIERGDLLAREVGQEIYHVARFREKPSPDQAQEFVATGRFYWNTGYFAWTLDTILDEFRRSLPETAAHLEGVVASDVAGERACSLDIWNQIAPVTIDVGIMERAAKVALIPCDLGWNDVGSWAALLDMLPRDTEGNVVLGQGQHVGLGTSRSLIYSEHRLVTTIGLEDMIVVDVGDAVLILPKSRAQDVSALVKELRARGLEQYL